MFMSKKFKLLTLGLAAALSVGIVAGCGSQNAANNDKKNFKIGIVQLVEHNALDAANKGFVDGLKERGYEEGKNITIDRQNAQADQSNLQNIGQRFVNDKVDLICAIATGPTSAPFSSTIFLLPFHFHRGGRLAGQLRQGEFRGVDVDTPRQAQCAIANV